MRQRKLKPAIPVKRQGYWYLERRVPARFVVRDPRKTVKLSTGIRITDDPRGIAARRAVAELDAELSRLWEGDSKTEIEADIAYRKASRKALELGVGYLPAARVAALPTEDLLKRIELLIDSKLGMCTLDAEKRTALAGKIALPQLQVSQMVVEFEKIHAAVVKEKSVNEKRKWRVPKETALAIFVKVIGGDRPLGQLTRADVLLWRQHWQDRVLNNEVEVATANKNIGRIAVMYNQINEHRQLGLPEIFRKAGISGEKDTQRVAFEARIRPDRVEHERRHQKPAQLHATAGEPLGCTFHRRHHPRSDATEEPRARKSRNGDADSPDDGRHPSILVRVEVERYPRECTFLFQSRCFGIPSSLSLPSLARSGR